jgi:hypothetical protein
VIELKTSRFDNLTADFQIKSPIFIGQFNSFVVIADSTKVYLTKLNKNKLDLVGTYDAKTSIHDIKISQKGNRIVFY